MDERRIVGAQHAVPLLYAPLRLPVVIITILALLVTLFMVVPTALFAQNQSGITSPTTGDGVSGDVIISGTAVIEPFLRYELYYKLEPSGDDAFIYFDDATNQVTNGQLGIWRTSDLAPGVYSIRLRVVKTDGNYGEFIISDLNVNVNVKAPETETETATPTAVPTSSEPVPTPIPSATFTPAPQPTPIVGQVAQPQFEDQAPVPSPTPILTTDDAGSNNGNSASGAAGDAVTFDDTNSTTTEAVTENSFTRQVGEAVALERLREYFLTGIRFSATLILGIMALFMGKWVFRWVWTQYR